MVWILHAGDGPCFLCMGPRLTSIALALHLPPDSTYERVVEHLQAVKKNAPKWETVQLASALLIVLEDVRRYRSAIEAQNCSPNCRSRRPMPFSDATRAGWDGSCDCWRSVIDSAREGR